MSLNDLYSIKELHKKGLISGNVIMYFHYVETFQEFRKIYSYRASLSETAIQYRVSEGTIENALRKLK